MEPINAPRPLNIYNIKPASPKQQGRNPRKKRFTCDQDEEPESLPDHVLSDEKIIVSKRDDEETGGNIDITG
ncbi:MAG: hypothetical protein ACI8X5_003508 [Planctomycetota bacterium]|jgi:hypothetical protein